MTTRNSTLDNAKAFAILMVVLAHMIRDGRYFAYFVPASVPVFFVLAGFTYHQSASFFSFLYKKIRTIVIPYLFAGIISIFIFAFLGQFASNTLSEDISTTRILPNLLYMLYGNGKHSHMKWNNSLWFLPCLFIVMLLVYLIESIVSIVKTNQFHKLILRIILCLLCNITGFYLTQRSLNVALPWHIETALCNVIFTEAGITLAPIAKSIDSCSDNTKGKKITLLLVFIVLATSIASFNGETSARTDEYGTNFILYFISAMCFTLAFLYAGNLIGSRIHAITYTGMNTLPILLWNKYPVIVMQAVIGKFTNVLADPDSPIALLVSVIPSIITIVICLIAGNIQKKLLPITLGIKSKKEP